MIRIPQQVMPSKLLWTRDLCQEADQLIQASDESGCSTDLRLLDALRGKARELLAEYQDKDCAAVLLDLADHYRECGDAVSALDCAEEAEQYLDYGPQVWHLHNRGVAHYSLGVAHHWLGDAAPALKSYNRALADLDLARDAWYRARFGEMRSRCVMAARCIGELCARLERLRLQGQPASSAHADVLVLWRIPVLANIAAGAPILADESFDEWQAVDVGLLDRVHFALRVRGESMVDAGIHHGDLALIEQDRSEPPNGTIVAVLLNGQAGDEATLKRYYRAQDHIRLEPANANYPFYVSPPKAAQEALDKLYYRQLYPGRTLEYLRRGDPRIVGRARWVIDHRTGQARQPQP